MPKRSLIEQLDRAVQALLARPARGPTRGFRSQRSATAEDRSRSTRSTSRGFQGKTEDKFRKELTNGKFSEAGNRSRDTEASRCNARRISHDCAVHHRATGRGIHGVLEKGI